MPFGNSPLFRMSDMTSDIVASRWKLPRLENRLFHQKWVDNTPGLSILAATDLNCCAPSCRTFPRSNAFTNFGPTAWQTNLVGAIKIFLLWSVNGNSSNDFCRFGTCLNPHYFKKGQNPVKKLKPVCSLNIKTSKC